MKIFFSKRHFPICSHFKMLSKLISLFSHYGDAVLTPFLISFHTEHATGPVPHNPGFNVVCPIVRGSHSTGKAAHPEQ